MPTNGPATAREVSKWRAREFTGPDGRNCRTLRNTCPIMADSALYCRTIVAFSAGMAFASKECCQEPTLLGRRFRHVAL